MVQVAELVQSKAAQKAEEERLDQEALDIFRDNVAKMILECHEAGHSVLEISQWIGVDRQNIYNWRNKTEPTLTSLSRLRRLWNGMDFMEPVEKGTFFRILTGKDTGLYRKYRHLKAVPVSSTAGDSK